MTQFAYTAGYSRAAFQGVRTRRLLAWLIDACLVGCLTFFIGSALAVVTFGVSLLVFPSIFPGIAVAYHALTVSGSGRGTVGMRVMDLQVLTSSTGAPASFLNAAAQAILFYVSWAFPLLFAFTLIDGDKRFVHDLLSDLVVLRRAN